jgi:hypothetical protein
MNQDSILHRQVHPDFRQSDGISTQVFTVTSQVFTPTSKDDGKLSMYNGDKFTARDAFEHFLTTESNKSCGVLSVSFAECTDIDLKCNEDNNPFIGHTFIDFNGKSKGQIKTAAKKLRNYAISRGWQHIESS